MKKLHNIMIAISVQLFFLQSFAEQPTPQTFTQNDYVKNECLIKFTTGTERSVIDSISSRLKFTVLAYYSYGRFFRVRVASSQDVPTFITTLEKYPEVELAQPDYYTTIIHLTEDSQPTPQWNTGNIPPIKINLSIPPDTSKSASGDIITGIIDGGVAFENYQQFKKARALSKSRFSGGFNFVSFDEHPNDETGSGTIAATIISNHFKNISDSTTAAHRTAIMPLKVTDRNGSGRTSALAEAIIYAVNNGADILTINVVGPDSPLLKQAIIQAFNRGVTIICTGGNATCPKSRFFPAAYNQYCIAVTADSSNIHQGFSVPHGDYIDLCAPGEMLFHNTDPAGYSTVHGNSVATAQVTATAVLLKLSGIDGCDRIRQALEQSCLDIPPRGWDWRTGWGTLDAHKALQFLPKPDHDLQISGFKVSSWCIKGELLQTIATVKNQGNFEHEFSLSLSDPKTNRILAAASGSLKPLQSSQFVLEWNTTQETIGAHLLCVSASIPGDEDPADNMQYAKIFVAEDQRDIEISGVEFKNQPDKNSFVTSVQIKNSGTYNEIIHVRVEDSSGALLGKQDIQICAQCITYLPVQCQLDTSKAPSIVTISIETADLQESNLTNNRVSCPLIYSE